MFGRKKEVGPVEDTYPQVAEELHFNITLSVPDQMASMPFRSMMATYIKHKMAIERGEQALEKADLTPAQKGTYIRKFAEENKISKEAHTQIKQQLEESKLAAQALPESIFEQVAVNLALSSVETSEVVEESNVTDQLLADAMDKKAVKQQRQQQKEQDKTVKTQAKDFSKTQEVLADKLEKEVNIEAMDQRAKKLDTVTVELEQYAKPSEEQKAVPKVPADYEKEMLARQLQKQMQEPDIGFSSDDATLQ